MVNNEYNHEASGKILIPNLNLEVNQIIAKIVLVKIVVSNNKLQLPLELTSTKVIFFH